MELKAITEAPLHLNLRTGRTYCLSFLSCNAVQVEDEKDIVVGDIATVTCQLTPFASAVWLVAGVRSSFSVVEAEKSAGG